MATKGDIINAAYARIRISGLTVNPTPEDSEVALDVLEDMCAEFEARNICLNYNFQDVPDPADETGVSREFVGSLKDLLAWRMVMFFGLIAPMSLEALQRKSMSLLSSGTARVNRTLPSRRMPRGSGVTNRYNRWQRFNNPQQQAPIACTTNFITYSGVLDYQEDITYFLGDETIAAYQFDADNTNLTVVSSSELEGVISYRVECNESARDLEIICLEVETDSGRKQTFRINFKCAPSKIAVQ